MLEQPGLGQTVEVAVELQVAGTSGGLAGDPQGDEGDFAADGRKADPLGGGNDLDDLRGRALRGMEFRRRR